MISEGWNDGGFAASAAAIWLQELWDAQRLASIEAEEFYVLTDTRPNIIESKARAPKIIWPHNEFWYICLPQLEHDIVLFLGVEPNLRWKDYAQLIVKTARSLGIEMVFTLGSYFADVLHNTPVKISGYSNDINLSADYGIKRAEYEGPTGILSVCAERFRKEHHTTVNLWAAVPHYISMPNPKGSYSLLQALSRILNLELDLSEWKQQIDEFDSEIEKIIAKNPNVNDFVREMRKRALLS